MNRYKFLFITTVILAAVFSRLIPHPPNFAPIAAVALFGGSYFVNKKLAFAVPLIAMFISDLIIGLHNLLFVVYAAFVVIVLIGFQLREKRSVLRVGAAAVSSSVIFFIVTNFGVWLPGSFYPKTVGGLMACYVAAIPFFHNTLLGDLFYSAVLFGSFEMAQRYVPVLREA
ncbi:MAG: hypothetical protein PVH88_24085 [Ignavibacteria bacterium]|jgi:hypothetical protein